jgi:hypothetical protein
MQLRDILSTMNLTENDDGTILYRGRTLEAFTYDEEIYKNENLFHECGFILLCSHAYDADFCAACNVWVTPKCEDPNCSYCSKRPAKPLPCLYAGYENEIEGNA